MSTSNATVPAFSLFAEVSKFLAALSGAPKVKSRAKAIVPAAAAAPVAASTAAATAAVAAPSTVPGVWKMYRMTSGSDSVSPQLLARLGARD
jgi:hypothetical protein